MDMSKVLERIDAWLEENDATERKLSLSAGLSADGIRNWRRKVKSGNAEFGVNERSLSMLAVAMGVSDAWLRAGEEGRDRMTVIAPVAAIENGEPAPADTALVPVYDVSAAAGNGVVVDDYEIIARQLAFPPNYLRHITTTNPKDLAIISVTGGSMTPTLHHDDIVMVDTTKKNISYDGMFVIRHDGLLKVKRLHWGEDKKTIKVVSDNRLQHPEEEHSVSEIEVIGRVVWVGAKQP